MQWVGIRSSEMTAFPTGTSLFRLADRRQSRRGENSPLRSGSRVREGYRRGSLCSLTSARRWLQPLTGIGVVILFDTGSTV